MWVAVYKNTRNQASCRPSGVNPALGRRSDPDRGSGVVLGLCSLCRRWQLTSVTAVVTRLPRGSVAEAHSFEIVSVYFCGPLYHRSTPGSLKAYIAVFSLSCHSSGVHIKHDCLRVPLTFRRFIACHEILSTIISDNTLTFHHCAKFCTFLNAPVQDFCSEHHSRCKFNTE